MKRWLLAGLWCLSALWLAGCAGPQAITSQVSSYGAWPAGRAPGTYVFERLPSQQSQPQWQDTLEAAAQPALTAAGFKRVDAPEQAAFSVQLGSQTRQDPRPQYDPFWGPFGRFGWGGFWGTGGGGVSMSMQMEPNWVHMQVDVLIRDRRTGAVLYETHATHDRLGSVSAQLLTPLFDAALKDFPGPAVSPRTITVPVRQGQD
ncbi:MAG: DUF4136 domain-containing protein [Aquabacterium sp.]|uniref:DUF4136 domain-containing protein n=1 Tax=Aquabacterium sp. TaxID=1872578 RepID=UPI003BD8D8E7